MIRRYLIPALIVAMTGTGISFAATGGTHAPHHHGAPTVTDTEDTTEVNEAPETDENEEPDENEAPDAEHTPIPRFTEGCGEGFDGNHGDYVSHSEDKQTAAHSDCGKPLVAVEHRHDDTDEHGAPEISNEHAQAGSENGQEDEEHGPNEHANDHSGDEGDDGGE